MVEIESISRSLEQLRNKRQQLYYRALFKCPDCFGGKKDFNNPLIEKYHYDNWWLLEYELNHNANVQIGNIFVDCFTSDNYYICKCSICGATWQVSKSELHKEAKRLDKQIAKLEGVKFGGLKGRAAFLLILFGAVLCLSTLVGIILSCLV